MLFPLCRSFIYAQRQGLKFKQEVPIQISNNILIDPDGHQYQIQTQQTDIQGIASQFETQLNDKDEVLLYIKELNCNGQNIKTNIAINMKQQIQKSTESAILYKQIKRRSKIQPSFSKIRLKTVTNQRNHPTWVKKDQEQVPRKNSESLTITNNDISYIKYLESLSNGISKKYVIEFSKIENQK